MVFAHSLQAEALAHAKTVDGAVVRERETGTVVHPKIPAADLTKLEQGAEAPAAAQAGCHHAGCCRESSTSCEAAG
ncbi:hypothetical protein [Streptomyces sp. enrichment culture]|uniref:hypothetical protein n=1 Tax=Streptomyces sp. enrichment culture TaxID=1795815 RepID=UPI003F576AD2